MLHGVEISRRSCFEGLGSVTVGLLRLFACKFDAVLDNLERDLVPEQQTPDQQPSGAEIEGSADAQDAPSA